ncbi:hypothetical protein CIG19_05355 [Enterobacterales bacterium CwR94]|nr:hypothetical protein CIG19_05355 [Enterobacterales bacterium CwR94]
MIVALVNNLDKIEQHFPIAIGIAVALGIMGFFKWLLRGITAEHLFQNTLNNRLKSLKNELKDTPLDAAHQARLKRDYATLFNQKTYGIKNPAIQREVIKIIEHSSEITRQKHFAAHQHTLSLDAQGKVFINSHKVTERILEAWALLAAGLAMLGIGVLMGAANLPLGIAIIALGLLLYFMSLTHFPMNKRMRKRAQAEIDHYYRENASMNNSPSC